MTDKSTDPAPEIGDIGGLDIPEIDLDLFDITDDEDGIETRYTKPRLQRRHDFVRYDNAVKLALDLRLDKGERADASFMFAVADIHTKTVHFETDGGRKVVNQWPACLCFSCNIEQITIEKPPGSTSGAGCRSLLCHYLLTPMRRAQLVIADIQ